jgi:tRNA threonylcarbamoyladenosine modification (KEOPS) complex Cgi121 subunit
VEPIVGCGHLKINKLDKILSFVTPDLALVDSRSVCGIEHLHQAARLSLAAHNNSYNLSNDKSTEVLLYLTAQRQISKALKFAGINGSTKSIGWVSYDNLSSDFLDIVDKDDSVISVSNFDFSIFAKDIASKFDNNLKQKIVMTRTATLPTQTR